MICHFVSFTASNKVTLLGHSLISGDFTENILETLKDVELVIFPLNFRIVIDRTSRTDEDCSWPLVLTMRGAAANFI